MGLNTNMTFIFYKTTAELSIFCCYEPQILNNINLVRILCLKLLHDLKNNYSPM